MLYKTAHKLFHREVNLIPIASNKKLKGFQGKKSERKRQPKLLCVQILAIEDKICGKARRGRSIKIGARCNDW